MTPVEMLANSARPIADVLIDRLRTASRPSPISHLRRRYEHDDDDSGDGTGAAQAELALADDELRIESNEPPLLPVRPDEVAAAILLGRALDQNREVLRRLQERTTIAVIQVPSTEMVGLVERLLRNFVLGGDIDFIDGDRCMPGEKIAPAGSYILFSRRDGLDKKGMSDGNLAFGAAVQQRAPIIGIAADPDRALPSDLVKLADHRIALPDLDADAIAATVEAITGVKPLHVDEALARATTLGALVASVRADLGAEASLTRLKRLVSRDPDVSPEPTLAELHGLGAARIWGEALVADLRDYKAGRVPWLAVDRGCLLTGAPGTGKTTFATALARDAGVHFVATSYSAWQSKIGSGHLGDVVKAIRAEFAEARRHKPAIIFIDEIDTIPARGSTSRNDDWWTAITNCLLEELDGFDSGEGVVVIAACNDPARLDPALARAGRLDRHIEIPLPDVPALIGIFRLHLGVDLAGVDLRPAALAARGRTGADVERFVREARRAARKDARTMVVQDLLDAAGRNEASLSPDARRRIAYHEAGHAVVTLSLGLAQPVAISIEGAGGAAENEITSSQALTRGHCLDLLTLLLAGRAAEILPFGEPTAGAGGTDGSDLDRATQLALRLETSYGLGQLGPVAVTAFTARDLLVFPDLRSAVQQTLEAAEAKALELLTANRPSLDALGDALFESGYLDRAEIDNVLATAPLRRKQPQEPSVPSAAVSQVNGPGSVENVTGWPDEAPPPSGSSPP